MHRKRCSNDCGWKSELESCQRQRKKIVCTWMWRLLRSFQHSTPSRWNSTILCAGRTIFAQVMAKIWSPDDSTMGSESRVGSQETCAAFQIRDIQRQRKTYGLSTCKLGLASLDQRSGERLASVVKQLRNARQKMIIWNANRTIDLFAGIPWCNFLVSCWVFHSDTHPRCKGLGFLSYYESDESSK